MLTVGTVTNRLRPRPQVQSPIRRKGQRQSKARQKVRMPEDDLDPISEFIRRKGITRCPTACVLPTQASILAADRVALEEHAIARDRIHREQAAARWGKIAPFK